MALVEAQKERQAGEQAMATGIFKWKPDLLAAASAFNRAGDAYIRAMRTNDAVDCWERAADAATRDGNASTAAACLDKAAKALEREGRPESMSRIVALFERVSNAFIRQPDVVRAAESMASAATAAAKANDGAEAERLFNQAADLFDAKPDRAVYAVKPLRAGADHLVRLGMHRSAMDLFARLTTFYERCGQQQNRYAVVLSRVVLLLHAGDDVAAGQEFDGGMRIDGFVRSREGAAADDLIAAYRSMDADRLRGVTSARAFGYLDHSITSLARALKPAGGLDDDEAELEAELGGGGGGGAAAASASTAAAQRAAASMAAKQGQSASAAAVSGSGSKTMTIEGLGTVTVTDLGPAEKAAGADEAAAEAGEDDSAMRSALFATGPKSQPAAAEEEEEEEDVGVAAGGEDAAAETPTAGDDAAPAETGAGGDEDEDLDDLL